MKTKKTINKWVWITIITIIILSGIYYLINRIPVPPALP